MVHTEKRQLDSPVLDPCLFLVLYIIPLAAHTCLAPKHPWLGLYDLKESTVNIVLQ